ncbi:MAG: ankyrin repeat domain-containing protein [Vulcanimicrobiota bacterium]
MGSLFKGLKKSPREQLKAAMEHEDWNKIIELVKEYHELANYKGLEEKTPFQLAVLKGNTSAVKRMAEAGVSANEPSASGEYPLMTAIKNKNEEIINLLLEYGVEIDVKNPETGATPLHNSIAFNLKRTVIKLLEKNPDINTRDNKGRTPLHWASYAGLTEIMELLISKGADLEATEESGKTPLHEASKKGMLDAMKLLIDKGANISAEDSDKSRPIHLAVQEGKTRAVELLINSGADVNAKNKNEQTPLSLAIFFRDDNTSSLLRKHGANR